MCKLFCMKCGPDMLWSIPEDLTGETRFIYKPAVAQLWILHFTVILLWCFVLWFILFCFSFRFPYVQSQHVQQVDEGHSLACGKGQSRASWSQFSVLEEFLPLCASVTCCVCGTFFRFISSARQPALCFSFWQEFHMASVFLATHGNSFFHFHLV